MSTCGRNPVGLAPRPGRWVHTAATLALIAAAAVPQARGQVVTFHVAGDAIPEALDSRIGDARRGRQIVLDRSIGNCLICHVVPEPAEHFMGELGPDLSGVGARLTAGQLRLRLVDQSRLNPATIMPPYHRVEGLWRVGMTWRGKPVLGPQEIEDVVAYLATFKAAR